MNSTGQRNKIQVSQSTADLLVNAGKGHWLKARETLVEAKGKGSLQNFWLEPQSGMRSSMGSAGSDLEPQPSEHESSPDNHVNASASSVKHLGVSALWGIRSEISDMEHHRNRHQRLIEYIVDLLTEHLKQIIARRRVTERSFRRGSQCFPAKLDDSALSSDTSIVLDEVVEVIRLPKFNPRAFKEQVDPDTVELSPEVEAQLKRYVTVIAAMYRQNPFHSKSTQSLAQLGTHYRTQIGNMRPTLPCRLTSSSNEFELPRSSCAVLLSRWTATV